MNDEIVHVVLGSTYAGLCRLKSCIAGLRQLAIERKHGWPRDSIRHNSKGGIIRWTWSFDCRADPQALVYGSAALDSSSAASGKAIFAF
jgi:hypothetical protein